MAIRSANATAKRGGSPGTNQGSNMAEAATIKAQAQGLFRSADAILANKDLPAELRTQITALRGALKKKWSELAGDAKGGNGSGSESVTEAAIADALLWLAEAGETLRVNDSFATKENILRQALKERLYRPGMDENDLYVSLRIRDTFDGYVVFEWQGGIYECEYTINSDADPKGPTVTLGDAIAVDIAYIPKDGGGAASESENVEGEHILVEIRQGDRVLFVSESAMAPHKTGIDKEAKWDAGAALKEAGNDVKLLRFMHAWADPKGKPDAKGSYKFPHHRGRMGAAAVLAGVNNGLARLSTATIPDADRAGVERHLRKHRMDAGLEEAMSDGEIDVALLALDEADRAALAEMIRTRERNHALGIQEGEITGDLIMLQEAANADGTIDVKLIGPGWGTWGYYGADVLKRDGPKVFPKGTQMFWDHPGASEEADRPERSLRDLAAVTAEDARWLDHPRHGAGLFAKARVFDAFKGAVTELAPHTGTSIRALGTWKAGEAEGRRGRVIEALVHGKSVDFVTKAGAGGRVVEVLEAARALAGGSTSAGGAGKVPLSGIDHRKDDDTMADEALVAENKRLKEALLLREAGDVAADVLKTVEGLHPLTAARLKETVTARIPTKQDGVFDKDAFTKQVQEAAKAEVVYLAGITGSGRVSGMGPSGGGAGASGSGGDVAVGSRHEYKAQEAVLAESFKVLGLSDAGVAIASKIER